MHYGCSAEVPGARGAPKKRGGGGLRCDETAVERVNIANSVGLSQ